MSKSTPILVAVTVLLILSLACVLPNVVPAPTQDLNALGTMVMQTMIAGASQTAQAVIPVDLGETLTPLPTSTPEPPTLTPTITLSPTLVWTATSVVPQISVSVATNCRVGPGKVYDRVGALLVGQVSEVVGRSDAATYWYSRNPSSSNSYCWLWGQYATVTGNWAALPIIAPPPTPTPMPDFVAEYDRLEICSGWWVDIELENTGGIEFESIMLTIKDTATNVVLSTYSDSFNDVDGCAVSSKETLNPGNSPNISSPPFSYDPTGHELQATISLCSRNGQNGLCLTKTIKFKP
jgi:hypothetical protein